MTEFAISGVETYWWLPMLVAFCISTFTSTGGVTGAFVILPFQISVLGYTSPGASPTNLLYNIIAIPSGVYRFHRDRRMLWSMAWATGLGTIPGLIVGAVIRVKYLPDPRSFKFFAGLVLLALAVKMLMDILGRKVAKPASAAGGDMRVRSIRFDLKQLVYEFNGQEYRLATLPIVLISAVVGVIGGIYGIGGGAILAPFFVAVYRLPVHSIAGAMLLGTWLTSAAGIIVYLVVAALLATPEMSVLPDWWLGLSFGVGGLAGVYLGAKIQRFVPASVVKIILVAGLLIIAGKYVYGFSA